MLFTAAGSSQSATTPDTLVSRAGQPALDSSERHGRLSREQQEYMGHWWWSHSVRTTHFVAQGLTSIQAGASSCSLTSSTP